jgi:hypothetical protein
LHFDTRHRLRTGKTENFGKNRRASELLKPRKKLKNEELLLSFVADTIASKMFSSRV